ncbi:hypothetical protein CO155_03920 [Candidatus Pacearchaeota archaeon CG_4_9_14_3_um_filter_35_19]|nr:MAG: hypothetical protein COY79_02255 [Candidatus Pacearchaeota archaeon CG_4_10_14_0_8_um_filter_35_169]PJA69710.1 MAG: hypothetical protein CO155_03920 [Candidatus Pacearchaeota archaeon CG_4_9_14_3_um_filter_35_19]PJB94177.1 MAG: hypothetical protein CO081_02420 [Candidatus Pacearchaeota archaeon CG_4_9_14_0_8_um_filter_35_24]
MGFFQKKEGVIRNQEEYQQAIDTGPFKSPNLYVKVADAENHVLYSAWTNATLSIQRFKQTPHFNGIKHKNFLILVVRIITIQK